MAQKVIKTKKEKGNPQARPPVVVVMGHVNHGKTTLLDKIRQTRVAEHEAGMITQKIGAYQTEIEAGKERKKITFIDTPGHEAFAKMRARGAQITDIAVLVLAADDGVMPQTKESIKYLKETNTPFLVAINKIDLPSVNLEKVKKQLAEENVLVEGLGGKVVCIPVSAKTGQGIKDLLEMILLLAEMENLRADPYGPLKLAVVESRLDSRRGPVVTVIVQNGTLYPGDEVELSGVRSKVKGMFDENGQTVKEAPPSTPVGILGLKKVPEIGEVLEPKGPKGEKNPEEEEKKLEVILKADTTGSLEAIINSLSPKVELVSQGVGEITESEVLLAKTRGALILGFNLRITASVKKLAETEGVAIKTYNVIYELLTELEEAASMQASPKAKEEILGRAEIISQFPFNKEKIAGCRVVEGRINREGMVKIMRHNQEIGKAKIKTLKHLKEDIPKAEIGTECGVLMSPQLDFLPGDVILSYKS